MVLADPGVENQWAHTSKLVNAPQNLTLLNPGQCLRPAVIATGGDRDTFLEQTKLSFRVRVAGQSNAFPSAPLAQIKQIKPEGWDAVTDILTAGGIENPIHSMASLGASADHWCVPDDARDGDAILDGEVDSPAGHAKTASVTIKIESFETGSRRAFKDEPEISEFEMTYYRHPQPARLFPALQFYAADNDARKRAGTFESTAAFMSAALKSNPAAARDFLARVSAQTGFTRAFGLLVLQSAAYDIEPGLKTMNADDRQKWDHRPVLPDPFDFTSFDNLPTRLDMLWGIFGATGAYEPVSKVASALAWRSDYDQFKEAAKKPAEFKWTPAMFRGVTYAAAGWALGSFQRSDPLAADYIESMLASRDTPEVIQSELKGLAQNPVFHSTSAK